MAARGTGSGDVGFALVEALASLVIVAMIAAMLVEGVGTGRRVWERLDRREGAGEAIEAAQTTLRDRIEETYPATLFKRNPPYVDFEGDSAGLVFLANPPQSQRPAPLRRYYVTLDTAGELLLSSVSDVAPVDTQTAVNQVLLKGVRQVDVAYFGASLFDPPRHWRPSWRQEPLLPEAIRMRVTFEPGDPRRWPDLIIHPQVTVDTACAEDLVRHGCKGR